MASAPAATAARAQSQFPAGERSSVIGWGSGGGVGEVLAGFYIEFAGGEEWDFGAGDDEFWAPEGGEAFVEEFVA